MGDAGIHRRYRGAAHHCTWRDPLRHLLVRKFRGRRRLLRNAGYAAGIRGALDVVDQGRQGFRQSLSPSGFVQFANTNSWNYRMTVTHREPAGPWPVAFNLRVAVLTKG